MPFFLVLMCSHAGISVPLLTCSAEQSYCCIQTTKVLYCPTTFCAAVSYGASLPWCAPEQILHEPCTSATDMYAFGSVLWELITGELPTQQRQFRPPAVPEEAPAEIAALFARCHHANPRERPTAVEAHAIVLDSRQSTEMASVCVSHLMRE